MAKHKEEKTNVMRILAQKKLPYTAHSYEETESPLGDRAYGLHIAQALGQDVSRVYKTLVARGATGAHYVFCIPVAETLDLKKAAKAVGEKSVELIAVRDLLPLTGYVRGGCSPVGMKKQFPTVFHSAVTAHETVFVSAGRIGAQVELAPAALLALLGADAADIIVG
ncbi:MAG: Cys-tRNA(Pro) deacylase [Oscillospiraceae bacterium]|nr:Cys-tRNA(Pro) deacylase [Oscillospiraceae bacterium]